MGDSSNGYGVFNGIGGAIIGGLFGMASDATNYSFQKKLQAQQHLYNQADIQLQARLQALLNQDQYSHDSCMQASAYGYDKKLAALEDYYNRRNATIDYNRQVKYIADSLAAYKSALYANGYNPMLALDMAIPSYGGHTNSASAGSVGSPSTGSSSISGGGSNAAPQFHSSMVSSAMSGASLALDFSRTASEVAKNEATAEHEKAMANKVSKEVEGKFPAEIKNLEEQPAKTKSETIKNYSSIGSQVLNSAGTAYAAKKASEAVKALKSTPNPSRSQVQKTIELINGNPAARGNSAHLGSRVMQSILPLMGPQGGAALGGAALINEANKRSKSAKKVSENLNVIRRGGMGMY